MVAKAVETAALIASKSPVAVQGTKRNLVYRYVTIVGAKNRKTNLANARDLAAVVVRFCSRDHSVAEGLDYVATWNASMLQTVDIGKGVEAFSTKQTPVFDNAAVRRE